VQLLPVLAEPAGLLLPVRACCFDEPPERLAVIELPEMEQLVDDDVLEHL
jgi:hypothetical protein